MPFDQQAGENSRKRPKLSDVLTVSLTHPLKDPPRETIDNSSILNES
jgi:hypothetical protein